MRRTRELACSTVVVIAGREDPLSIYRPDDITTPTVQWRRGWPGPVLPGSSRGRCGARGAEFPTIQLRVTEAAASVDAVRTILLRDIRATEDALRAQAS